LIALSRSIDWLDTISEVSDYLSLLLRKNDLAIPVTSATGHISVGSPSPEGLPGYAQLLGQLRGGEELLAFDGNWHLTRRTISGSVKEYPW
jgi:hypothetical protein